MVLATKDRYNVELMAINPETEKLEHVRIWVDWDFGVPVLKHEFVDKKEVAKRKKDREVAAAEKKAKTKIEAEKKAAAKKAEEEAAAASKKADLNAAGGK